MIEWFWIQSFFSFNELKDQDVSQLNFIQKVKKRNSLRENNHERDLIFIFLNVIIIDLSVTLALEIMITLILVFRNTITNKKLSIL
jgi:hypothetical protein